MSALPPVFVISGQLAAGKSTLARAVLERFPFGVHIDVDGVREMVTSGRASPIEWSGETARQFDLALPAGAAIAAIYAASGFAVAIEGGIDPVAIEKHLASTGLAGLTVGVILHPTIEVALRRNRERRTKAFDPRILEGPIRQIDAELRHEPLPPGWTRLDNSDESIEETTRRLLRLTSAPK